MERGGGGGVEGGLAKALYNSSVHTLNYPQPANLTRFHSNMIKRNETQQQP